MTSSRDSATGKSMFTAHAAALLRHFCRNSPYQRSDDAARPLLDDVNQEGYERIKGVIHNTYPRCDIFKIQLVNSPEMYGMYLLHKEEMRLADGGNDVKEKTLYNVTSEANATQSLISGVDWRRNQRPRFGPGVSFSNNAAYSNCYADESSDKVISSIMPSDTADTTVNPDGNHCVKYSDFDSYPMFFVYYRWTPELLHECNFFFAHYIDTQMSQKEQKLVEDRRITESSSLHQNRRLSARKRHGAVDKADAESEAAALLKRQNKNARDQPCSSRQSGSVSSHLSETRESDVASAYAATALLKRLNEDAEKRSLEVDKAEAETESAALQNCPNKNTRKRRQSLPEPKPSL